MESFVGFLALVDNQRLSGAFIENLCLSPSGLTINFSCGAYINYSSEMIICFETAEQSSSELPLDFFLKKPFQGAQVDTLKAISRDELHIIFSNGLSLKFLRPMDSNFEVFALTYEDGQIQVV